MNTWILEKQEKNFCEDIGNKKVLDSLKTSVTYLLPWNAWHSQRNIMNREKDNWFYLSTLFASTSIEYLFVFFLPKPLVTVE